jgi:hypothetical protein
VATSYWWQKPPTFCHNRTAAALANKTTKRVLLPSGHGKKEGFFAPYHKLTPHPFKKNTQI